MKMSIVITLKGIIIFILAAILFYVILLSLSNYW